MARDFVNPAANVPAPFRFIYDDGCTCLLCAAVRERAGEEAVAYGVVTRLVKEYNVLLADEAKVRQERLKRLGEINQDKELAWDAIRRAKALHQAAKLKALEYHQLLRGVATRKTKARF